MENDELTRLLDALPGGKWQVVPAQYADGRSVVAASKGQSLVVATDMTPEAATFLAAARDTLPELLQAIQEERAYYARLEAENERLHQAVYDLTTELAARELEVYRLTEEAPLQNNATDEEPLPVAPGVPRMTMRRAMVPIQLL